MNTTVTAQLVGIEHLSAEQTEFYNALPATKQAAFLSLIPVPVVKSGPLYPVFTFEGEKVLGLPTFKLAWSSIGGGKMADIIDAQTAKIKAGELTTDEANAKWGMILVHSDDTELDTGDLDTAGARSARQARDAEYRRTKNGADAGFTPVPGS